jgi:hypothetical protein
MSGNDDPWFRGDAPSARPPVGADPFGLDVGQSYRHVPEAQSRVVPPVAALISRPLSMHVAFSALLLAAALALLTALLGVLTIFDLQGKVQTLIGAEPSGIATVYTDDYIDGATLVLVFVMVAVAAGFACGYLLFARAVFKGRHWPRTWALPLAVISLFGLFGGPLITVIVVLGLIAAGALWLPPSRRYCDYASTRL